MTEEIEAEIRKVALQGAGTLVRCPILAENLTN